MKQYIYKSILLALLSCAILSCKKDFLNIVPKGSLVATTIDDYALLMNYPNFYVDANTGGWQVAVGMGDEVDAEASYFNSAKLQSQNAFKWADDIYQPTDFSFELQHWLTNLYSLNKVINEVLQSTGGTDQQKKSLLAEAMATRAWTYFQLINFYGKPYVAANAANDPGFPIIKTADVTANAFIRNSVKEVYDFIISDFTSAIASLPVQNTGPTRFSKAAAEGLLGKVYLFIGRNSEALGMFDAAFADNAKMTTPARLYDYNKEFAVGGKFLPITSTGPSNSPGVNVNDFTESLIAKSFYNGPDNGNGFMNDFMVISPKTRSLFTSSDLRLNFYAPQFPYEDPNPSGRLSKYGVIYTKYGLQISELYLLRAECRARLNDFAGAKTDLETLRKTRIRLKDDLGNDITDASVPAPSMASQKALIQFVFDERIREFALEGYRWFDMRRESVDPLFAGKTYTHKLYNSILESDATIFTLKPERLTFRIPPLVMNSNPQFQNNP